VDAEERIMGTGIFNLVVGLLALGAGLSGKFTFVGTNSSTVLVVIGAIIAALGVYQIARSWR